jgi:hypothetical protein
LRRRLGVAFEHRFQLVLTNCKKWVIGALCVFN